EEIPSGGGDLHLVLLADQGLPEDERQVLVVLADYDAFNRDSHRSPLGIPRTGAPPPGLRTSPQTRLRGRSARSKRTNPRRGAPPPFRTSPQTRLRGQSPRSKRTSGGWRLGQSARVLTPTILSPAPARAGRPGDRPRRWSRTPRRSRRSRVRG